MKYHLKIDGMSCMKCVGRVTDALQRVEGVQAVDVDLESGSASIEADSPGLSEALRNAVIEAGYSVADQPEPVETQTPTETARIQLTIGGMHCAGCAQTIEKGLSRLPGIESAQVNFASEKLTAAYDPQQTDPQAISAKVRDLGYQVVQTDEQVLHFKVQPDAVRR